MTATAAEPTLEEQVLALKATATRLAAERAELLEVNHRLLAERDVAFRMAAQATKEQDRDRRELLARIKVRDVQIDSLRAGIDGKNAEIRRLDAHAHRLAIENEDLRKQHDAGQQEPRPVRQSWWSRRIGNQL